MKSILSAGIIAFGLSSGAQAQNADTTATSDKQSVIMVLDGSGSMWGQIDGKPKIEIARNVIGELLTDWDENVELGLMAYGHREKGACGDIETLVDVGPVSKDAIMSKVNAINPVGKTPISASVRQAADTLKFTEEKATVILVSDGLETCKADPCALAKELESKGVDFTAHVIGFDVAKEDRAKLSCLAEETGGEFFSAENSSELNEALTKTVEAVAAPEPVAEPEPAPVEAAEVAAEDQGVHLRAKLCEECEILDKSLYWQIYEAEAGLDGKSKRVKNQGGAQPFIVLVPGDYRVHVTHGDIKRSEAFTVTAEAAETLVINLDAGLLKVDAVATEGGEVLDNGMYYKVYEAKKGLDGKRAHVANQGGAAPLFRLPAGDYVIEANHGEAKVEAELSVKAGEREDYTFDMNVGYLKLTAILAEGEDAIDKGLYFRVLSAKKDLDGKRDQIAANGGKNPTFKLPDGDYVVSVKLDRTTAEKEVTVTAGEMTEDVLVLGAGRVKMRPVLEAGSDEIVKKTYWNIYDSEEDLDGKRDHVANATGEHVFALPAGDYFATAKYGSKLTEHEFSVKAGDEKVEEVVVSAKEETEEE